MGVVPKTIKQKHGIIRPRYVCTIPHSFQVRLTTLAWHARATSPKNNACSTAVGWPVTGLSAAAHLEEEELHVHDEQEHSREPGHRQQVAHVLSQKIKKNKKLYIVEWNRTPSFKRGYCCAFLQLPVEDGFPLITLASRNKSLLLVVTAPVSFPLLTQNQNFRLYAAALLPRRSY